MTIEELLEQARPIALQLVTTQRAARLQTMDLIALINRHREACGLARELGEKPREVAPNWMTALVAWAAMEIGDATPEAASRLAASALGLRAEHDAPNARSLPPARCIELMLSQQFENQIGGN